MKGTFPGGRIDGGQNDVALVNNVAKQQDYTVPAGEMWILWGGRMHNGDNVTRNGCTVTIRNPDGNMICQLATENLAAGASVLYPETDTWRMPMPLGPGFTIRYYWPAGGASTGGTANTVHLVQKVDL